MMWRFLAGVASALLLVGAGLFVWKGIARSDDPVTQPGQPLVLQSALPSTLPTADRSREEKRFDRYDKDRDDVITKAEYLAVRHKAFDKLDLNSDGRLSFDEWAARTADKFTTADSDHSETLTRDEFATTRAKRNAKPRCDCSSDGN